jgi:S-adenosylmethionine-dependent methyltransferase
MKANPTTFDESLAQWSKEMTMPWGKLKYKLTQSNLARHLAEGELRVLDAGGGNGTDAIALVQKGHRVEIIDYSKEMLADAQRRAADANVAERITIHHADLHEASRLFRERDFDVIVCHNVVGYVKDAPALLKGLVTLLKVGGVVSVVGVNRYSVPYHAAFLGGNLTDALAKLGASSVRSYIFDTTITTFSAEDVSGMLQDAGCHVEQDYGIRCLCDYWGDNERKSQPEIFEQLERLEFAFTDKHPYKLLARYFDRIANDDPSPPRRQPPGPGRKRHPVWA